MSGRTFIQKWVGACVLLLLELGTLLTALSTPVEAQELTGVVRDYASGRTVENARVQVLDADMRLLAETSPDEAGGWAFAPATGPDDTVYVAVSAGGYSSWISAPLTGNDPRVVLDVRLVSFDAVGQAQAESYPEIKNSGVFGRVVDATTKEPIAAARVILPEGRETKTMDSGFFAVDELAPGLRVVRVEHLAYAPREAAIRLRPGQAAELRVELTAAPLELEPIKVTVASSRWLREMRGFERRRETRSGRFYTREQIEARAPRYLGDLLSGVAGLRMTRSSGAGPFTVLLRGKLCRVKVWVDGVERFGAWGRIELEDLLGLNLEAVEIYKALEAPAEYYDPAVRPCVTVIAWTRRLGG